MRFFTTLATFGLVALVSAQSVTDSTSIAASNTQSSAPASTSLSAEDKCLQACDPTDICCQAACVNVPCPSQLQANETTACAAKCPQGNGSPDETSSYAACQASCVSSLFYSSSLVTGPAATGTSGGSGSGSAASVSATATSGSGSSASSGSASSGATGSSDSGSGTSSATSSGASSSSTSKSDASSIKNQVAGAGLIGLIIAGLAL